ncbi:hypothetical protein BH09BAC6_BH09BAC6_26520 [soil metagenome]|jgi:predicted phage tail protein
MQTTFRNIADFKNTLASDTDLQTAFKDNPVDAAERIQESPLDSDIWIYRIVVGALGAGILLIIIGVLFLIGNGTITGDKTVPTILTAIGSAAIGALSGLLAPSPKNTK